MSDEFHIETAPAPRRGRGRLPGLSADARKKPLVLHLQALRPGQVLRWRGERVTYTRANNAIFSVRNITPEARYTVRKEDGGLDIYRLA